MKESGKEHLTAIVDLDNVGCNTRAECRVEIIKELGIDIYRLDEQYRRAGKPIPHDLRDFDEIRSHPDGLEMVNRMFFEETVVYERAKPMPGFVEYYTYLSRLGFRLPICTARPGWRLGAVTRDWTIRHGLGWATDQVIHTTPQTRKIFSGKQMAEDKNNKIAHFRSQIIIEDMPLNLAEMSWPGIMALVLLDFPYNQHFSMDKLVRVYGAEQGLAWPMIASIIIEADKYMSHNVDTEPVEV